MLCSDRRSLSETQCRKEKFWLSGWGKTFAALTPRDSIWRTSSPSSGNSRVCEGMTTHMARSRPIPAISSRSTRFPSAG